MSSRAVTIAVYAVLAASLVALEVAARLPVRGIPTFSKLLKSAMHRRASRIALVLAWWWIGWHFFVG